MKLEDLIKVSTAAKRINVSSQYIHTLIKEKELTPIKIDKVIFVDVNEVDRFEKDRKAKQALKG
jgi:hypothetical protein